ncbi:hypothetical protein PISMIDRAFT_678641 [Pisolithus microcarpus 441]|uniref:Uncharacterized protein n=1 Tax=Pisolithus microcarpus 441 TaxID=765257 RepID=A0A0C9YGA1_9AGAM|nr:hypothetical protein PISMIDRAFT_678641 [Pisolithus microcarpus 441]
MQRFRKGHINKQSFGCRIIQSWDQGNGKCIKPDRQTSGWNCAHLDREWELKKANVTIVRLQLGKSRKVRWTKHAFHFFDWWPRTTAAPSVLPISNHKMQRQLCNHGKQCMNRETARVC